MSDMRERVGAALSDALHGDDEMVTRWVAVVETIDAEGERALWALAPEGAKPWDSLGLLTFAVQLEQSATVRNQDDL